MISPFSTDEGLDLTGGRTEEDQPQESGGFLSMLKKFAQSSNASGGSRSARNYTPSPSINPRDFMYTPAWTDPELNRGTIAATTLAAAADQQAQQRGIEVMRAATAQHEADLARQQAEQQAKADDALSRHIAGLQDAGSRYQVDAQKEMLEAERSRVQEQQDNEDLGHATAFEGAKTTIENQFKLAQKEYGEEVEKQTAFRERMQRMMAGTPDPEDAAYYAANSKDPKFASQISSLIRASEAKEKAAGSLFGNVQKALMQKAEYAGGAFVPQSGEVVPYNERVKRGFLIRGRNQAAAPGGGGVNPPAGLLGAGLGLPEIAPLDIPIVPVSPFQGAPAPAPASPRLIITEEPEVPVGRGRVGGTPLNPLVSTRGTVPEFVPAPAPPGRLPSGRGNKASLLPKMPAPVFVRPAHGSVGGTPSNPLVSTRPPGSNPVAQWSPDNPFSENANAEQANGVAGYWFHKAKDFEDGKSWASPVR